MGSFSHHGVSRIFLILALVFSSCMVTYGGNFYQEFDFTWGGNRAKIFNGGQLLSLSLDKVSGSGFKSKKEHLFGRIDMQIKLVAGNSAGTVTTYYVSILRFTYRYSTLSFWVGKVKFECINNHKYVYYVVLCNNLVGTHVIFFLCGQEFFFFRCYI